MARRTAPNYLTTSNVGLTPEASPDFMGRFSRPGYQNSYYNGLGVVPRQGWDAATTQWLQLTSRSKQKAVADWAQIAPLLLLRVLAEIHPLATLATRNNLSLGFAPDDIQFVAMETVTQADGTTTENQNSEGTAALNALWKLLPAEFGSVHGLLRSIAKSALFTGLAAVEAVPQQDGRGVRAGQGIGQIYTIDTLTLRFRDTNEGRVLEQQQFGAGFPVRLPLARVFWGAMDGDSDNPYGVPMYAAFLTEGLADLQEQRNLSDLMYSIVWPRLFFAFPYQELYEWVNTLRGTDDDPLKGAGDEGGDLSAAAFVQQQMEAFKTTIRSLFADDQLFGIKGGEVKTLTLAEGLRGLEHPLTARRLRIAQSLNHPPTLLGMTQGGTQAYSTTEWRSYAKSLESLRGFAINIVERIGDLHLRLLGMPLACKAKTEKTQTSDKLVDAQAEEVSIRNTFSLLDRGVISPEEASIRLSGSAPHDESRMYNPGGTADPYANSQENNRSNHANNRA